MNTRITATEAQITAYVAASGRPRAWATTHLNAMEPNLRERVVRAVESQSDLLHDPIEDVPALAAAFREAEAEARGMFGGKYRGGLGFAHQFSQEKQRILRERFGIEWYTPAEMNPDVDID